MTPEQFCYWLRGAIEVWPDAQESGLSGEQVKSISAHLDLVMTPVVARAKEAVKEPPSQKVPTYVTTGPVKIC